MSKNLHVRLSGLGEEIGCPLPILLPLPLPVLPSLAPLIPHSTPGGVSDLQQGEALCVLRPLSLLPGLPGVETPAVQPLFHLAQTMLSAHQLLPQQKAFCSPGTSHFHCSRMEQPGLWPA